MASKKEHHKAPNEARRARGSTIRLEKVVKDVADADESSPDGPMSSSDGAGASTGTVPGTNSGGGAGGLGGLTGACVGDVEFGAGFGGLVHGTADGTFALFAGFGALALGTGGGAITGETATAKKRKKKKKQKNKKSPKSENTKLRSISKQEQNALVQSAREVGLPQVAGRPRALVRFN